MLKSLSPYHEICELISGNERKIYNLNNRLGKHTDRGCLEDSLCCYKGFGFLGHLSVLAVISHCDADSSDQVVDSRIQISSVSAVSS